MSVELIQCEVNLFNLHELLLCLQQHISKSETLMVVCLIGVDGFRGVHLVQSILMTYKELKSLL